MRHRSRKRTQTHPSFATFIVASGFKRVSKTLKDERIYFDQFHQMDFSV